jgi:putative hydrolase of the HAD superfamily
MSPLRALILDYGDVLCQAQLPDCIRRMAEVASVPVPAFTAAYWAYRDPYHVDWNAERYWRAVLDHARSPLGEVARREAFPTLSSLDATSWTAYRESIWNIAATFKDAGRRTAMLSNGVPEVMARVREERNLERFFDVVVVSCEVGCAKPDPAIYELTLRRLQVEAEAALFVDDRTENLEAARAIGLQTFHFIGESEAALRECLASPTGLS